jgi:predicted DCC family thiol-disulfide oxidoreductase YuxK
MKLNDLKGLLSKEDRHYTPYQFALFRMIFGVYLLWHFLILLPNATELFSSSGILANPSLNFTYPIAPWNPLYYFDSPSTIYIFVSFLILLSAMLVLGWQRPIVTSLLWFGWACLYNRNNLISNPSIPYIGLLLLLLAIIPKGEPLAFKERSKDWQMPLMIPIVAWILMAVGYTFSGIDKLFSPSWQDGTAMLHLLENPLARDNFLRDIMLILPLWLLKLMTWGVIIAEITFLPLCLCARGRLIAWSIMVLMHIGIMMVVSFADLSIGMLMIHLFTFDQRWLGKKQQEVTILYDGECGLCSKAMRFLAEEDSANNFKMRSLQEPIGQELLRKYNLPTDKFDTMVLIKNNKAYIKSEAVIESGKSLGGIWSLGCGIYLIPKGLRESGYEWISKNRISFFGKKSACEMPSKKLKRKLIG